MKIKIIIPNTSKAEKLEAIDQIRNLDTQAEIDVECIEYGTVFIESMYDRSLCAPGIIRMAEKTQAEGYDGILIKCMLEPALDAVRERLVIPVVGPARISMLYAAELAHKFSVVTVYENICVLIEKIAVLLGLKSKLASVRSVNTSISCLDDRENLLRELVNESIKAIDEDKAHAIVLGFTGKVDIDKQLQEALREKGYDVPVIAPLPVSIKYLETLISLKLTQSKKTYLKPPEKERNIWERLEKKD